jgi:uncharacterized protein YjdB/alpha-tubulin suppressor-like RCC1 family protein
MKKSIIRRLLSLALVLCLAFGVMPLSWLITIVWAEEPEIIESGQSVSITDVSIMDYTTLAVDSNNNLWAWGENYLGQIGNGVSIQTAGSAGVTANMYDYIDISRPLLVGTGYKSVSEGARASYGIKTDGSLYVWGDNYYYELGNGTNISSPTPAKMMDDVLSIDVGVASALAMKNDGSLWLWGTTYETDKDMFEIKSPICVWDNAKSFSAGRYHYLVVDSNDSLWSWGYNPDAQCGAGFTSTNISISSPVKLLDSVVQASGGYEHSLALTSDGKLYGWGDLTYNRDETVGLTMSPVVTLEEVKFCDAGNQVSYAIKNDDSLWVIGEDANGTFYETWTKIMDSVKFVESGANVLMAIKLDGTLWGYGWNCSGQIGVGTPGLTNYINSPQKIMPFSVSFCDYDGSVIEIDLVNYGLSATAPTSPTRDGYTFSGWSTGFSNVTSDLTVTAQYTVNQSSTVPVSSVFLDATSVTLDVDETVTLTATITPSNATNQVVSWTTTDSSIASVTNGVVTAVSPGIAVISVITADSGFSNNCTVTVNPDVVPVTGVSLDVTSVTLDVGGTANLNATVSPTNASNQAVSWSTTDSAIASVSNGVVTAVSEGTATITVTTTDGGYTATCTVTVNPEDSDPVVINVTGVTLSNNTLSLETTDTATLIANIAPSDASNPTVTWSSSDNAIATVSGGVVTGVSAGTATITVTTVDGGYSAQCTVTVSEKTYPVTGITLDRSTLNMNTEDSTTLIAAVTPTNATNKAVIWSSSNSYVADVSNGLVSAISPGTTIITATTSDGSFTAQCTVTVSQRAYSVTSVSVTPSYLSLTTGDTAYLNAAITPTNATNQSVTWYSDNPYVASVQNGLVTAVSAGTARITVTATDGEHTAYCTVTVSAPTPAPSQPSNPPSYPSYTPPSPSDTEVDDDNSGGSTDDSNRIKENDNNGQNITGNVDRDNITATVSESADGEVTAAVDIDGEILETNSITAAQAIADGTAREVISRGTAVAVVTQDNTVIAGVNSNGTVNSQATRNAVKAAVEADPDSDTVTIQIGAETIGLSATAVKNIVKDADGRDVVLEIPTVKDGETVGSISITLDENSGQILTGINFDTERAAERAEYMAEKYGKEIIGAFETSQKGGFGDKPVEISISTSTVSADLKDGDTVYGIIYDTKTGKAYQVTATVVDGQIVMKTKRSGIVMFSTESFV